MVRCFSKGVALSLALLAGSSCIVRASQYTLTILPTLGGDTLAYGVNGSGQVVGSSVVNGVREHAFIWDSTLGMQDLGTVGDNTDFVAFGINDSGNVVGRARGDGEDAFYWSSGSGMQLLSPIGTDLNSQAKAINNAGQISGTARTADGDLRAVRWGSSVASPQDLGVSGLGHAINGAGDVAGEPVFPGSDAFLWSPSSGVVSLSQPVGGIGTSAAYGINDAGQVVGLVSTATGAEATLWTSPTSSVALNSEANASSTALDVNNAGTVVGSITRFSSTDRAFRWDAVNGFIDLNTLIDPTAFILAWATAVSDTGYIVGFGNVAGGTRLSAFILTPFTDENGGGNNGNDGVPAPGALVLLGIGLLGIRATRRLSK